MKRSAAWVTGWWFKYQNNFFVRTHVNVITLQVVFVGIILLVFFVILRDSESKIVETITNSINLLISSGGLTEVDVNAELAKQRGERLVWIFLLMSAITILFGAIITRLTLYPARRALEAQKQFISNISHELRTPLAILRMNTDIALMDTELPRSAHRAFASNVEELARISEILNNLLSLSSFTNPTRMEFKNVHLGDIASRVITRLGGLARKRKVKIYFEGNRNQRVWGNATALEQVVMNLLRNAILYSEAEGVVRLRIDPDERGYKVLIMEDSGVGISPQDMRRIFDPFYRTDQSRKRSGSGSGLGLTITSEIIKLHRGKIAIHSTPQVGTTVVVHIPKARDEQVEVSSSPRDPEKQDWISIDFSQEN